MTRRFNTLFGALKWSFDPCKKLPEVMLLGEANREAPAQAELHPTCAGPAMSKRQRVEWASCVNLPLKKGLLQGPRHAFLPTDTRTDTDTYP